MSRQVVILLAVLTLGSSDAAAQSTHAWSQTRRAVLDAARAMERDGGTVAATRWTAALHRVPGDRVAMLGLATLARFAYRADEADRSYKALAASSAGVEPDLVATYASLGEAEALYFRGRVAAAEPWYLGAALKARALHDSASLAEALLGLVGVRRRMYGQTAAVATLDSARRVIPAADAQLLGWSLCSHVFLAADAGANAAADAASGAALARRAGDHRLEARCLFGASLVTARRGGIAAADRLLQQSEAVSRRARDRAGLGRSLRFEAVRADANMNYGLALSLTRAALTEAEAAGDETTIADAVGMRSVIAASVGDLTAAAADARRERATFEELGDHSGVLQALGGEARIALESGDTAAARSLNETALRGLEADHQVYNRAVVHRNLADVAMRRHDWRTVRRELDTAVAIFRGDASVSMSNSYRHAYGSLALRSGDLVTADQIFHALLREPGLPPDERYALNRDLAETMLRRGDTVGAGATLNHAATAFDAWRASLGDRELRTLAFDWREFGGPSPSFAFVIGGLAQHGDVAHAFALAEGRRARMLVDELVRAQSLRELGARSALRRDAASVLHSASSALPMRSTYTSDALARALPDDHTALLEFVVGPGVAPTTLFIVTKASTQAVTLPSAEALAGGLMRLNALVTSGMDARGAARDLSERLLGTALTKIPEKVTHLLIVPDGVLYDVPFALLHLPGAAGDRTLVDRFALSTVPSARVAATLWRRARALAQSDRAATPRILAFGDPTFPSSMRDQGSVGPITQRWRGSVSSFDSVVTPAAGASASPDDGVARGTLEWDAITTSGAPVTLPRLLASADEVRRIARYSPRSVVRLREAASKAYLMRAPLDSFAVLHFATHALVDEQTMTRTVLVLAPGGGENGYVTPADLSTLHLRGTLVVLSACRTARGVVVGGEGVRGLTAPLLEAGAQAIVASRWKVGDRETIVLMDSFYDGLASGLSADDALRRAQLETRRRGAPPRVWSSFILTGNPSLRVRLPHRYSVR